MKVLGIETSCDETAIAVYDSEIGLLAHEMNSQANLHNFHGGVVPELASRDHIRHIFPLLKQSLLIAKISLKEIDSIAYCAGPGLIGSLLVGAAVGRSLGWALNKATIGIHHLEAHLLAPMLEANKPNFPFIALLVSGGHTLLVKVTAIGEYKILGESLDDAAGEAFDKTAKALGLSYPGGPALSKLAEQGKPGKFYLPKPMTNRPGLDFSFSGLKTAVFTLIKQASQDWQTRADIAYAFQEAITDTLVIKCKRAIEQTHLTHLVIAGGVSANQVLRKKLQAFANQWEISVYYPRLAFCTDNAAMIAYAGYQRLKRGQRDDLSIKSVARWSLEEIDENILI